MSPRRWRQALASAAPQTRRALLLTFVVLLLGLGLSALAARWVAAQLHEETDLRFEQLAHRVELELNRRLQLPVYALHGTRGIYAAGNAVQLDELRAFVDAHDLNREYPGLLGLGIAERTAVADLPQLQARVTEESGSHFEVQRGPGEATPLYVLKYIEPLANNVELWGRDLGADLVLREAIERALRNGEDSLSGRLMLPRFGQQQPGFMLIVPIYRRGSDPQTAAQRERALLGFACAPIVANELLLDLGRAAEGLLAIEVFEGEKAESGHELFASAKDSMAQGAPWQRLQTLQFGGRHITLQVTATDAFVRGQRNAGPLWVALAGAALSLLLALALWLLLIGRQRAEALAHRLTQDLERLATVAQRTANAVICTDAQLRITWVNDGFSRVSGYSAEQAMGRTAAELFAHPGSDPQVTQAFIDAARAGLGCRQEVCNRRADGQLYWVETDVQPVHDALGRLTGFIEIALDISERKRDQLRLAAALRENDDLLSTIRQHAIVSITDARGIIISANEAFCRISKYSEAELLGHTHAIVYSGVQSREFWGAVWQKISMGQSWRGQVCNRAKDGELYWVDSIIAPIRGDDGQIERYVSIRQDVTAARQASRELRRERERLNSIIDGTNAATWEWNLQTDEVIFNERWAEMIGYQLSELQPLSLQTWRKHVHPNDLRQSVTLTRRHLAGELPAYEAELRLKHRDGHWIWVLSRGKVIAHDADGKPTWMAGTHLDITARKQAEQQLRESQALFKSAERLAGVGGWALELSDQCLSGSEQNWALFEMEACGAPSLAEMLDCFLPRDREYLQDAILLASSEGQSWDLELELRTVRGRPAWLRSVGELERDEQGQARRVLGAFADISGRRALEAQMRSNNALLRSVLDSLPCALSVFDGELKLIAHNQQFRSLLGFPDQLFEGGETHFEDIIRFNAVRGEYGAIEDVEPVVKEIIERARYPEPHQLERTRPNGITLEVRGAPMPSGGFVTTYVDISERKRLEGERQRSNELLRVVLENLPCGLTVIDPQLQMVLHNNMYDQLYELDDAMRARPQFSVDELLRSRWKAGDFGDISEAAALQLGMERVRYALHSPHHWERMRPDGVCLEIRSAPVPGLGFVSTYTDVSAQRRAAQELARTVALLNAVLDSSTKVGIVASGTDRQISLFNRGAEQMLGYRAEEVLGRMTSAAFLPPLALAALAERVSAETGEQLDGFAALVHPSQLNREVESSYINKEGRRFQVLQVISELRGRDGVNHGYLAVFIDITRQKDYEAGLEEARRDAEQASVAKSQFLANMSHEIRTPMNAILGLLTLLKRTPLNVRQLDYASKTEGAARSLLSLLNDILDFSKVEAGKMGLDPQPFRLEALLRDLAVIMAANLGGKPLELLFDVDPRVPALLLGDALRLQQVLINLAGNAIKFTAQGEVVVSVQLREPVGSEAQIEFAVADTGIGIAEEHRERLFSAFSQAEASTTRRFGGTGLGLAISQRLVQLMGGHLHLDSEVGHGSRFSFVLKLPVPPLLGEGAIAAPTVQRLLIVDDHAQARHVLAAMASGLGCSVELASSLAQAEALLQVPHRFDAVLLDWQLPGQQAWQQALRAKLPALDGLHWVALLSAQGREQLSEISADAPDAMLVKPISAGMLLDALNAPSPDSGFDDLPPQRSARLAGLRLLLVEDNPHNQQVATELLADEGAEISVAENGQLALDWLARQHRLPDAVLMDVQMPVMDGLTATRKLRQELGLSDLPVIAMTANAMASDLEQSREAGMNAHVGKPFELDQLVSVLLGLVRREPAVGEPPVPSLPRFKPAQLPAELLAWAEAQQLALQEGLDRFMSKTSLYLRTLASTAQSARQLQDKLPAWLATADCEAASQALHAFKGLSATVGAHGLARWAAQGEKPLASGQLPQANWQAEAQHHLSAGSAMLDEAAQRLRAVLPDAPLRASAERTGQPERRARGDAGSSALRSALKQGLGLLQDSDMDALQFFESLMTESGGAYPERREQLQEAIANLDFAAAASCVKAWLEELA
ncbi:PAS domain S-box protein [Paucibacter sp. APW11]|uniref:histidine kinase n=1 Tax=Roseateles aquae TaxID=3077235 RepID=A0ABU3P9W9_9BURK|nr:PAS domain S-box protein [Paucibacter sp. APW11]